MVRKDTLEASIINKASPVGVIILFILSFLTLLFFVLSNQTVYESKTLLAVINIIFLSVFPFAAAYISSSSYLKSGLLQLLFLGGAIITFGICNLLAAWGILSVSTPEWTNFLVTIHNTGVLVFAIVTFGASMLVSAGTTKFSARASERKIDLSLAYISAVVLAIILTVLTLEHIFPPFVVLGGFTLLRQSVLAISVVLLGISSLLFGRKYVASRSPVLYWYCLGLGLIGLGILGILLEPHLGTALSWTGRTAQYAGCVFFVFAALSKLPKSTVESSWVEAFGSSRKQLTSLFSNMLNSFSYNRIIKDSKGKPVDYVFLAVNDAFEKATGLKKTDIIDRRATAVLPGIERDPAGWIDVYGHVALTGEPAQFENYVQSLGRWYKVSAYCPEKGYFVSIFEDITERKKAEEALKETEQRLRIITDNSRDGINLLDLKSGKYIFMNPAQVKLTGFSAEEINNISAEEAYQRTHPDDREKTTAQQKRVAEGEEVSEPVEYRWKVKSGEYRWFSDSRKLVQGENGQAIAMVGISRDITDHRNADESLAQAQLKLQEYATSLERLVEERTKQLKDAERLATIGATAGMVGHDIRNPLQAIVGDLYLARQETGVMTESEAKKTMIETIDAIEENVFYINKIVADLQDYARPLSPCAQETNIRSVIEKALANYGDIPKNVEIQAKVDTDSELIMADEDFLKRIIGNLILNAIQAMPKGGILTVLSFKDKQTNDTVLTVKDTGVGIPDEIRPKIFAPMMTTKSKGQGFGLAVVKRMTEGLGGTISFESQEGKGTTFTVRLPPKS